MGSLNECAKGRVYLTVVTFRILGHTCWAGWTCCRVSGYWSCHYCANGICHKQYEYAMSSEQGT